MTLLIVRQLCPSTLTPSAFNVFISHLNENNARVLGGCVVGSILGMNDYRMTSKHSNAFQYSVPFVFVLQHPWSERRVTIASLLLTSGHRFLTCCWSKLCLKIAETWERGNTSISGSRNPEWCSKQSNAPNESFSFTPNFIPDAAVVIALKALEVSGVNAMQGCRVCYSEAERKEKG